MYVKQEKIYKELELIPEDKKSLLLNIIKKFRKSIKAKELKNKKNTMLELDKLSIETGIEDLAENHDYYLYGLKRE